jgi:hypothetical protein
MAAANKGNSHEFRAPVFLEEFERPAVVSNAISSVNEFNSIDKQWKELTSTSPSGKQLCCKVSLLEDSLNIDMLKLPIIHGFANSVTPLIRKDGGNQCLTHLRVIDLFEPDNNPFLKLLLASRWSSMPHI